MNLSKPWEAVCRGVWCATVHGHNLVPEQQNRNNKSGNRGQVLTAFLLPVDQQCFAKTQNWGGNRHHFMLQICPDTLKTDKSPDQQEASNPLCLGRQQFTITYLKREGKQIPTDTLQCHLTSVSKWLSRYQAGFQPWIPGNERKA